MNAIGFETKDLDSEITTKKIVYINKAMFEQARIDDDFFTMRAVLQNIYDNLFPIAKRQDLEDSTKFVLKVLTWYDNNFTDYLVKQPDGSTKLILPNNISIKINTYFSRAYIRLNKILGEVL